MSDIKTDPPAESKFQTLEYLIPKLALACDIRIASSNSKIGQTEVKIGIHPSQSLVSKLSSFQGNSLNIDLLLFGKISLTSLEV